MIVGIDVYHDKSQKKQSIAGFVASTNAMCTRWYSRVCIQPINQELIDGLKMCMISAITKYHEVSETINCKNNKCLPKSTVRGIQINIFLFSP